MVAMVEIKQLTKRFKSITAVNDISFNVERGEVMGFLGPNGAGKSTTMKMIAGFLSPDQGSIHIKGADSLKHPVAAKKSIGYLPEGAPLYGDMTPRLFLEFAGTIRGFKGVELQRRIEGVVHQVNLDTVLDQPIDTLSKGFKRRVGIAQAILHDPDILILDTGDHHRRWPDSRGWGPRCATSAVTTTQLRQVANPHSVRWGYHFRACCTGRCRQGHVPEQRGWFGSIYGVTQERSERD